MNDLDRNAIAETIVLRLRRYGRAMSDLPSGVRLAAGWEARFGAEDVRRIKRYTEQLVNDSVNDLRWVTIGEVSKGLGLKLAPSLRLLARLESDAWSTEGRPLQVVPPLMVHQDALDLSLDEIPTEDDAEFMNELGLVRGLTWLKDVSPMDLRFCVDGHKAPASVVEAMKGHSTWSPESCRLVRQLARCERMTFAEEVQDLGQFALALMGKKVEARGKWLELFKLRFVSPEGAGRTLAEAGAPSGLTRERVRQILDQLVGSLASRPVAMPATSRVIAAAARIAPEGIGEMNRQLARMLGDGAGLESVLFFAREIGVEPSELAVEESFVSLGRRRVFSETVTLKGEGSAVKATLRLASRQVALMGCTNTLRVAGALALEEEIAPGRAAIESILTGATGFRWLDQEGGWFTVGDGGESSAAGKRIKKMAEAAEESLTIESITSGLVCDDSWLYRERDRDTGVPPMHVLTNMLKGWPWLKCLQHNRFEILPGFKLDALTAAEHSIVEVVKSLGGAATRRELYDRIVGDQGVTSIRVQQILGNSPMLMKLEHGIYGLRGHRLGDDSLARARQRVAIQRQDIERMAPPVGGSGFAVVVTVASLKNEQYHVPVTWLNRIPPGTYQVTCTRKGDQNGSSDDSVRTMRVRSKGGMVGINQHFPEAQPGDCFVIDLLGAGSMSVEHHRGAEGAAYLEAPEGADTP